MNNCPTSILHLPDDCLYFIFQRLNSGSDRESFGLTCRHWLHIQNLNRRSLQFQCSLTELRPISLSQPSTTVTSFHLYRLLNRYPCLQFLSLSGCTELPDSGLSLLILYRSKLQSLHLDCCFGITDHGLSFVATGCPFLTNISLYRCNITDSGLNTLSEFCLALKHVNLSYCSLISDRGIRALSKNCQHLQAMNISHCRSIDGVGFQGCSRNLTFLEADSCKFEPEGIRAIFSGGGVQYLNVSNLSWCVRGHGFGEIDTGSVSNLRVLNFRLCRTIGDEAVVKIARGCPFLEEWNLALCHDVTVVGWEAIGAHCSSLKRLHVNRCRNLCDRGLQALRDGCKRLVRLYWGRCPRVSCAAVETFKLLRGNVQVTDEEVVCIAPDGVF